MNSTRIVVVLMMSTAAGRGQAPKVPEWSYTGSTGPEHWGDLSPEYSACKTGKEQSPIDIRGTQTANLPALKFDYKPAALKLVNNGHTVQVNYPAGSFITVGDQSYELKQFHFHRPSDERIGGEAFDMVIHLVHANAKGELAVVSVLVQKGRANATLGKVFDVIPKTIGQEQERNGVQVDPSTLLPANTAYYTYRGSLTTPPCTEGVTWLILSAPVKASAGELESFASTFHPNARPTQPLGGRTVRHGK